MLSMVRILGNDDATRTLLHEDLQRVLEGQVVTARLETDDDAHGFPLTREGDHLHDLCQLASFLRVLPTKVLGKLEKVDLGLRSHEGELFGLRVNVFKSSRVDHDRLVEQVLQLRGKDCVDVALLD